MEVLILDDTITSRYLIDDFESLIWNEAYIGYGNFELYAPINVYILEIVNFVRAQRTKELDTYVWNKESNQVMIIEQIEMSTMVETGPKLIFSGRSLESIVARRIIWKVTTISGNLQNGIQKLLNENIINPEIPERKISRFRFLASTDPRITALTLDKQMTGDNLYDAIYEICQPLELGFRVHLDDDNMFTFSLYFGTDRSYDQTDVPYVIFSPKFENLVASNFLEDVSNLATITLVAGEDEGVGIYRKTTTVGYGSGLARRELYTDARDLQSEYYDEDGEQKVVPEEDYIKTLQNRGTEKLSEHTFIRTFEGEVEAVQTFVYDKDFTKGDIVQVETEYGVESKMRIMQMVRSQDASGYNAYPIFQILE